MNILFAHVAIFREYLNHLGHTVQWKEHWTKSQEAWLLVWAADQLLQLDKNNELKNN